MAKEICKHRGRPKACTDETQRRLIIDCSRRLFLEQGYGATRTEDIAAQCKISKQTLYRLFPGKSALFAAIVDADRPQWLELPVPDDLPLAAALERIFRIDISEDEDRQRLDFFRMTLAEAQTYPELSEITRTSGAQAYAALAIWMQRQADRGVINLALDALTSARMLSDMIFGAMIGKSIGDFAWRSGEARRAHIRAAIHVFLHGVCPAATASA
nr:TetR/AcrR family transcriptional regulator [uncultured Acidocella sp.]